MEWIFSALSRVPKTRACISAELRLLGGILAYAFLIFCPARGLAQTLVCSEEMRNDRDLEQVQAIAYHDTLIHVIEERDDHVLRWSCYGALSMQTVRSTLIRPAVEGDQLIRFFVRQNIMTTISKRRNRNAESTEIYVTQYDRDGKCLLPEKLIHTQHDRNEQRRNKFECKLSPDSAHILVYFDSEKERKHSEGISFKCFTSEWILQWEKEIRLPPSTDVLQPHHFLVDNDGGVYMMSGQKPVKAAADWIHPQGGKYVVYYYNPALNKLKQYDINLKDKQVVSVDFMLNQKQELVIAGYYSDNFQNRASGTLLFSIQAGGGRIKTASYTPFAKEFIKEMTGKEKGTLDEFYLDYLYLTDSGNVVLAGEQYYVSRLVSTDPTTGRQLVEYRYNFDDIMVCMMDTGAKHLWNVRIPKKQFTSILNDANFSYSCTLGKENVSITFNDSESNNAKNKAGKLTDASPWVGSKNSVTTRVDLGFDGVDTRYTLVDNSEERLLFNPFMCVSSPWSQHFLGLQDKRSYKFCRIR
jgi:hypothetical protein